MKPRIKFVFYPIWMDQAWVTNMKAHRQAFHPKFHEYSIKLYADKTKWLLINVNKRLGGFENRKKTSNKWDRLSYLWDVTFSTNIKKKTISQKWFDVPYVPLILIVCNLSFFYDTLGVVREINYFRNLRIIKRIGLFGTYRMRYESVTDINGGKVFKLDVKLPARRLSQPLEEGCWCSDLKYVRLHFCIRFPCCVGSLCFLFRIVWIVSYYIEIDVFDNVMRVIFRV